jgi:hypothetical protein
LEAKLDSVLVKLENLANNLRIKWWNLLVRALLEKIVCTHCEESLLLFFSVNNPWRIRNN